MLKRGFDLVISSAGLVLSAPVLLVAAILIKLDSRGPVIFKQKRVGKDGKLFDIYKLRTMVENADELGPPITSRNDPRITQLGVLLRWLKLDELPQLWNVFLGDMSIVGPRPEVPEIAAGFSERERKIFSIKPGIFGPNQVIGRNELDRYPTGVEVERYYRSVILPEKLKIDLDYVTRASFFYDLLLMVKGIWATLAGSVRLRYVFEGRRRFAFLLGDAILTSASYYLAFLLRFDFQIPPLEASLFLKLLPFLLLIRIPLYIYFGLYQTLWQYAGSSEMYAILKSVGLGSLFFVILSLFQGHYMHPRSVFAVETLLTIFFLGGFRIGAKTVLERFTRLQGPKKRQNVLIIGAGDNGETLARELARRPELGLQPVGFLDNDLSKQGAKIHGIKVFGDCSLVQRVAEVKQVKEVIIAAPSLSPEEIQGIASLCRQAGLRLRIGPPAHRLVSERSMGLKIRDLKVDDLLGREEVKIDATGIYRLLLGKTVMVTGGGGTIGAELCRRISECKPETLVILDRSENDLYEISFELSNQNSGLRVEPCLADITDRAKLKEIFARYRPDIIFHAAAYKHVPMMEANVRAAIVNNVLGTQDLADLALEHGTGKFIFVSTDKAVNALSVMGMTKRVAELLLSSRNHRGPTQFIIVRFGNVLGSRGSVVPLMLRQIELGGPVTITDPRMERYFMGLTESVMLILQAACLGQGGEIFILKMGRSVKIVDLANLLIRSVGFSAEEIETRTIGLRPGERIKESLLAEGETVERTPHEKIRLVRPRSIEPELVEGRVRGFIQLVRKGASEAELKAALHDLAMQGSPPTRPPVSNEDRAR